MSVGCTSLIKEVIVVEGKQDIQVVKRSVEAEVIATGGFALNKFTMARIENAYKKRGIIILTDPDSAGERIRRFLSKRFPQAKHAFVPKLEATADNDIGIENASIEAIRTALSKVRTENLNIEMTFSQEDIINNNLSGTGGASERRARIGALLGIGYANAKQFLYRLNAYGVTRQEFDEALRKLEDEQCWMQLSPKKK